MEEMAKAIRKPSRRRRSRARWETRSERSESFRSESGHGSDQARSTLSSVSAPATFADRLPPDRPGGAASVAVAAAASTGSSARPAGPGEQPPALRPSVSTCPPEWSLECGREHEERSNSCGSSSTIGSTNSSDDDHGRFSRSLQNSVNVGSMRSSGFQGPSQSPSLARVSDQSPRRQYLSPAAINERSRGPSHSLAQPISARKTPARRRQLVPKQGMVAASISSCLSNGGEPGRHQPLREGKSTMCEDRCNERESSTTLGGVVGAKHVLHEQWERGAKASSGSSRTSDKVSTRKVWGERELEEKENGLRNELEESAARGVVGGGTEMLPYVCLPAMTAKPADDWDPASDSVLPAGKLNGWANTQEDEDWLEDFDKTPSSEIGSHKTCSTQWSEMESQLSGVESQLSGNSFTGEESSLMSALPPRRRPIPTLPTSPRQLAPDIAEAKCPPYFSVLVSPAVNKQSEDPWHCHADGAGVDTAGATTPGAATPGALRARL
eukprot:g4023.t1